MISESTIYLVILYIRLFSEEIPGKAMSGITM